MLKPDYFNNKSDRILALYQQLEDYIMSDIAMRLLKSGEMSGTADRLIWKLKQMGESQQAIFQKLQKLTKLSKSELKALLQDAVLTSWEDDRAVYQQMGVEISSPLENAAIIRVMDAEYKKSLGELSNLTRTTMDKSQLDLMNMLDEAEIRTASGAQSYSAAVCEILDNYAGKGFKVKYPTGVERTLESSVLMIVRTSLMQTASRVTLEYVKEADTSLILTSAHYGARFTEKDEPANHMSWQGRVFSIKKEDLERLTSANF